MAGNQKWWWRNEQTTKTKIKNEEATSKKAGINSKHIDDGFLASGGSADSVDEEKWWLMNKNENI